MKLQSGKLDSKTMERSVYSSLGSHSSRVLVGPRRGLDSAVVSVRRGLLMVVTTDPVSIIPSIGMEASAWLSVHLIASDYTTSGLEPQFATFTFNLPSDLQRTQVESYLRAMGSECEKLSVAIVAGHTGSYPGGGYTVIGGGSMFGFCGRGEHIDATMARAGDTILMTKGAAIEATAMLAHSFPLYVREKVGSDVFGRAKLMLRKCSTVRDALVASSIGTGRDGVTSMHDATEGGVLGALGEMAGACDKAFVVERERVHVPAESEAVCSAFGIDPLTSESEGTLLLTCDASREEELLRRLRRHGIPSFSVGHVRKGRGLWVSRRGVVKRAAPTADKYWEAYERSVRRRLK